MEGRCWNDGHCGHLLPPWTTDSGGTRMRLGQLSDENLLLRLFESRDVHEILGPGGCRLWTLSIQISIFGRDDVVGGQVVCVRLRVILHALLRILLATQAASFPQSPAAEELFVFAQSTSSFIH